MHKSFTNLHSAPRLHTVQVSFTKVIRKNAHTKYTQVRTVLQLCVTHLLCLLVLRLETFHHHLHTPKVTMRWDRVGQGLIQAQPTPTWRHPSSQTPPHWDTTHHPSLHETTLTCQTAHMQWWPLQEALTLACAVAHADNTSQGTHAALCPLKTTTHWLS